MEKITDVQQLFFQHIKTRLSPHLSFVDEIAGHLNISNDSAYRRIRGEKPISFEEIRKLCTEFKISLDQFLHLDSDSFIFSGKLASHTGNFFGDWLKDVLQQYAYVNSFEDKHLYFITKDIPFISFFQVPELARFKFFLWMRTFMQYDDLKTKKFSLRDPYPEFEELGRKIIHVSNLVPTTEIWSNESINATIHQIEFYNEANVFESRDEVQVLFDKLEDLVNHFEKQAETGKRFGFGEIPTTASADYQIYLNELFVGDNTVIAAINDKKISFLNHSVLHIVRTSDERFSNYVYDAMMNMVRKSTKISSVGEKSRSKYFNALRGKIARRRNALKHAT